MSTLLLLETATPICSVVLERDGQVLSERASDEPNAHSSKLAVFINDVITEAGVSMTELDAICVSSGPGSYTGLRIGVSSAKGLCYALNIPLISVSTLTNMASGYYKEHSEKDIIVCPMIDARRMECYTAIFNQRLIALKEVSADIIEDGVYDKFLNSNKMVVLGDGAEKTMSVLGTHPNVEFDLDYKISAKGMIPIAEEKYSKGVFEDVAYFEPFYLKDFVAKKPVVKGLR